MKNVKLTQDQIEVLKQAITVYKMSCEIRARGASQERKEKAIVELYDLAKVEKELGE